MQAAGWGIRAAKAAVALAGAAVSLEAFTAHKRRQIGNCWTAEIDQSLPSSTALLPLGKVTMRALVGLAAGTLSLAISACEPTRLSTSEERILERYAIHRDKSCNWRIDKLAQVTDLQGRLILGDPEFRDQVVLSSGVSYLVRFPSGQPPAPEVYVDVVEHPARIQLKG
ncbi:MAG TPA: hypothetical protein VFO45_00825, partial [Sphingomicrobium sp.]|nr:hypothetical protein [Sphingomicrobium sp.]